MLALQEASARQEYRVGLLHPSHVSFYWPQIGQLWDEHPPRGGAPFFCTKDQLLARLMQGVYWAWLCGRRREVELLIICCLMQYPATRTVQVLYAGGKGLRKAMQHIGEMEQWALANECSHIECHAVPALAKLYARHGFASPARYMLKPLMHVN